MPRTILVHVCCAPCAAPSLDTVREDVWSNAVMFYSNSNIYPRSEYDQRLEHVRRLASIYQLDLVEDDYDHESWLEAVKGLEEEPEQGERCRRCFEYNLRRAAAKATCLEINAFTTTLTVSPHKDFSTISAVGSSWPGYVPYDFKKNNGIQRSGELSRKYRFYRQNYCGCEFSLRDRERRKTEAGINNRGLG